jgi:TDG/mug DNA glycosylase family protein
LTSEPAPRSNKSDEQIFGFAPLLGASPRVLILGSMPSVASLERQQYYGKPQNRFWSIMGELFGAGPQLAYAERSAKLATSGVAVWDVLAACSRPGSLDSAIDMNSIVTNDIAVLLTTYPGIRHVFFNGRKAEEIFVRRLLPLAKTVRPDIRYDCLPSTSPAMATLNFEQKLERWAQVRDAVTSSNG